MESNLVDADHSYIIFIPSLKVHAGRDNGAAIQCNEKDVSIRAVCNHTGVAR